MPDARRLSIIGRVKPKLLLLNRDAEIEALDVLLTGTSNGVGGALVLREEPGAGGSSLLESAIGRATHIRVIRLAGVEAETPLDFAALHQLLIPFLPRLGELPEPQRDALRGVFGIVSTAGPNRFLVGVAVLTLLVEVAAGQPLLVAVNDAQWLDRASAEVVAFVARRLRTEPIVFLFAVREPGTRYFDGLPEADTSEMDRSPGRAGVARYAATVRELGLGRYEQAATSALDLYRDDPPDLGTQVLPDLVEAAARSGNPDLARAALDRLAERTVRSATPLALGLLARSRALLAADEDAESMYREAIHHLSQPTTTEQLARAHLLYGEWLRRRRRRRDAREQLSTARDLFNAMGMTAFAHRSTVEQHATGEHARPGDHLTPQESQVVRLVVEGSTNRQIAARLFISPNTVEYHLHKVFRKIGVSSRTQLVRTMLDQPVAAAG